MKQVGRAVLLKIGDGEQVEAFTTVATLNTKTMTVNNTGIDATTPDADDAAGPLWRESLSGLKTVDISGDGIFADTAQEVRINTLAMSGNPVANFQVTVPELGTFDAEFRITSFELGGETEGATTFSISLESNGKTSFTAAA